MNDEQEGVDVARILFIFAAALLVAGLAFAVGFYSAYSRNAVFKSVRFLHESALEVMGSAQNLDRIGEPVRFYQPARYEGAGVTVNELPADDDSLVMLVSLYDDIPAVRLIERDGTVLANWEAPFLTHFPDTSFLDTPPQTNWNVDLHGAVVMPDGSVLFNYEYSGTVKLSRCGEVIWRLEHPTHHTLERAEGGGFWISGRNYIQPEDTENRFPPFTAVRRDYVIHEDLILRVSEEGEILQEISVPQSLYDAGLAPLLGATGDKFDLKKDDELVHVNKINELPSAWADAFEMFEAGDLLVSMRTYNLIVVIDPDTGAVKWHQTGPWQRQHDPEFHPDGTMTVFNNNVYLLARYRNDRYPVDSPRISNILRHDFATGETSVVYGNKPGQEFLTFVRGDHDPQPNGGIMVTEFEGGRVFEFDADGRIIWEYINRLDDDEVIEISGSRVYPRSYFEVEDWSCPPS